MMNAQNEMKNQYQNQILLHHKWLDSKILKKLDERKAELNVIKIHQVRKQAEKSAAKQVAEQIEKQIAQHECCSKITRTFTE